MLPPLPTSAGAGRRFLRDRLNDWGYPLAHAEVPCLLISELVSYLERRRDASSQRDVYEQQQAEAQRHEAEAEAAQAQGAVAPGNGRPKRTTARHK